MADRTVTRDTTLPPEEVLVRAVQFFTNEKWRAQSQSSRIATFVGVRRIPWLQIVILLFLFACFLIPGIIYYFVVVAKARRLQNIVVTTSPKDSGGAVVVTYPPHAQKMVDAFFGSIPAVV